MGGSVARNAPHLSLPGKLVFPSSHSTGHFSMLGLGDIVMPGLLLCFVMRYDAYKKAQHAKMAEAGIPLPNNWTRISYFHCSLFGYFLGLLTATISSEVINSYQLMTTLVMTIIINIHVLISQSFQVFKAAQPALLYLVPFTLLPLFAMAYLKVRFNKIMC